MSNPFGGNSNDSRYPRSFPSCTWECACLPKLCFEKRSALRGCVSASRRGSATSKPGAFPSATWERGLRGGLPRRQIKRSLTSLSMITKEAGDAPALQLLLFRTFILEHSVIVSDFDIRISSLSLRHWIMRAEGHPRHAAKQTRCGKPKAFRETVREHRFLGIMGAGRLEPANDETIGNRFQERPIPAEHELLVKRHGDLLPGRLRPIENRAGDEDHRRDPGDPDAPPPYGWPQCGQTGLPSMRFFWQCGHTTSLTFGRVARWTISPTSGTSQPRIVTS
jgi:hypothetical protein